MNKKVDAFTKNFRMKLKKKKKLIEKAYVTSLSISLSCSCGIISFLNTLIITVNIKIT